MLEMLFANIGGDHGVGFNPNSLLLALTPLLRRRYAAKWRYWVWFALAARLLIPLNISLPKAPVQVQIPNRTVLSVPAADTAAQISAVQPAAGGEPVQIPQAAGVCAGDDHAIGGNDLAGRRGLVFAVAGGLLSVFCPAGAPVEPTGKG